MILGVVHSCGVGTSFLTRKRWMCEVKGKVEGKSSIVRLAGSAKVECDEYRCL